MLVKTRFYTVWKNKYSTLLKRRRVNKLFRCLGINQTPDKKLRILELGCANGKDLIQFLNDPKRFEITGIDINPSQIDQENFTFVQADASELPFEDKSFDIVFSVGLLEHIEPMEKLCGVIKEISRVGKSHANIIPSVASPLEPHAARPFWSSFLHKRFIHKNSGSNILKLNYFTDHTWTKFEGFNDCDVARFWYLPPFILNLVVYKRMDK